MNAAYLRDIGDVLAKTHRVLLPDQRGTGGTARPPIEPDHFTMETYVGDLLALKQHLDIQDWSVVGHSWGGWLA